MERIYYSFKDYLLEHYGIPYYRVPIDLALSCPHKTNKNNGCIFCAEDGARAVHLSKHLDLKKQVEEGIKYVENRYNAHGKYIVYFQSYTNTNANAQTLEKLYEEVLSYADFKIIIISTRPDCLSNEILYLLEKLNQKYDLWIELGVQTTIDTTLKKINRGHNFAEIKKSVKKLNKLKIKTVGHIILGLPDETYSDYVNTINELNKLPFTAYKIHNLLLLKNSPLANMYNKSKISKQTGDILIPEVGTIKLMNEFEYAGIIIDLIRRIPEDRPLLRLTADAVASNIIGPKWNLSKGQFLELVKNTMHENGFYQGELIQVQVKDNLEKLKLNNSLYSGETLYFNSEESIINNKQQAINYKQPITNNCTSPLSFLKIKTNDNSFTFYSPKYKENYHSLAGAVSEAKLKFVIPSDLAEKLTTANPLQLLDIGFGLGYNTISAIKTSINLGTKLSITSFELDLNTLNMGLSLFSQYSIEYKIIQSLLKKSEWNDRENSIRLFLGDARKSILLDNQPEFDIVFLDAFSPQKNPELWTYDFIKQIYHKINYEGVLVTYSSAFSFRGALIRCGFHIGETEPFGRKKGGTIASKNRNNIKTPLLEQAANIILKSAAGIPYRDPTLNWNSKQIFSYRDKLSKKLRSKGIPKWFKN